MKYFPDFIKKIELESSESKRVQFVFDLSGEGELTDYHINWGADIVVNVKEARSQTFELKTCMNLFLKRSLKLTHKESNRIYFMPYLFNREVTDVIKIHELGGACEYIEAFLGDSSIDYESELFYEMYGKRNTKDQGITDIDREGNLTIKMQRFTTLLPRLEQKLGELVQEIRASKVLSEVNAKRFLNEPIQEIISIIEKEYESEKSLASIIYKLGEILLIIKQISVPELSSIEKHLDLKFKKYFELYEGNSNIFKEYINYVQD